MDSDDLITKLLKMPVKDQARFITDWIDAHIEMTGKVSLQMKVFNHIKENIAWSMESRPEMCEDCMYQVPGEVCPQREEFPCRWKPRS